MSGMRLERLPVELLHELFAYFWADELLYSFHHLNSHFTNVLQSYQSYAVNLQGRKQSVFDLICQQIAPQQVISLTISDDVDTPGQPDLFFSRYKLADFTRLRSLNLVDVTSTCWEPVGKDLAALLHLRSFAVIVSDNHHSWLHKVPNETVLDQQLFAMYSPILPRLYRLELSHGDFLSAIQFQNLRRITLRRVTYNIIQKLARNAPKLSSLKIKDYAHPDGEPLVFPFPTLKSLDIDSTSEEIHMHFDRFSQRTFLVYF